MLVENIIVILSQAAIVWGSLHMMKQLDRRDWYRRHPPTIYFGHIKAALEQKRANQRIAATYAASTTAATSAKKTG